MPWEQGGGAPSLGEGVRPEGFLAEMSLDVGAGTQAPAICKEAKGVGCLETRAEGTACESAWSGKRGCPGTHGVSSGSLRGAGAGRWSWKGKQSLQDAEYSRTTKELVFHQLGQYPNF